MSTQQNDIIIDHFLDWLNDFGLTIADVKHNNGEFYVLIEDENGTSGEDGYSVKFKKVLVPHEFVIFL